MTREKYAGTAFPEQRFRTSPSSETTNEGTGVTFRPPRATSATPPPPASPGLPSASLPMRSGRRRNRGAVCGGAVRRGAPRCAAVDRRHHCGTTRCSCEGVEGNGGRGACASGRGGVRPQGLPTLSAVPPWGFALLAPGGACLLRLRRGSAALGWLPTLPGAAPCRLAAGRSAARGCWVRWRASGAGVYRTASLYVRHTPAPPTRPLPWVGGKNGKWGLLWAVRAGVICPSGSRSRCRSRGRSRR